MCPANICVPDAVDSAAARQPLGDVDTAAEEVTSLAVVLADAADVCEHHGWRLDSENEGGDSADEAADIDDEDEDAGPGAVGRRRSRPGVSAPSASLPAPAGERHPEFSGARRDHLVWRVPGYGSLRYDTSLNILSAHCACRPHGLCRMNRTCKADDELHRGSRWGICSRGWSQGSSRVWSFQTAHLTRSWPSGMGCTQTMLRFRMLSGASCVSGP